MPKHIPDAVYDAAIAEEATATVLRVCSTPASNSHADIVSATLASVTMTAGLGSGDYAVADGDVSGRKLRVLAQTAIPVSASGTASHIALTKTSDTTVKLVTTCTSQALTSGNTVNTPEFKHEYTDPT
jgi:hypothetical protein